MSNSVASSEARRFWHQEVSQWNEKRLQAFIHETEFQALNRPKDNRRAGLYTRSEEYLLRKARRRIKELRGCAVTGRLRKVAAEPARWDEAKERQKQVNRSVDRELSLQRNEDRKERAAREERIYWAKVERGLA